MKQKSSWSCLPAAFAYILGEPVEKIIKETGHDGSDVIWPELAPPKCFRSWHIQELILVCLKYGYSVTCIERLTHSAPEKGVEEFIIDFSDVFHKFLSAGQGITAVTNTHGNGHALAFKEGKFFDPKYGRETTLKGYTLTGILWLVSHDLPT